VVWILIYKEEFSTRQEALVREKQLKSYRGREFVKKCIPL
jgi:predicted GIY-YIG superfamily endonuclease